MIYLANGVSFSCIASSGSRGWAGNDEGHGLVRPWKRLWDTLGFFPPIPVVAKTVTRHPRKGNLTFWRPWRAVRRLGRGSLVNAVGLTNPGGPDWIKHWYPVCVWQPFPILASIAPDNPQEAREMASLLEEHCPLLAGIEVNLSCPNSGHLLTVDGDAKLAMALAIFSEVKSCTHLPLIVKLGFQDDFMTLCRLLDGQAAAFHLINALLWLLYAPGHDSIKESPLQRYGYQGAMSGHDLAPYACQALTQVQSLSLTTPVISGGGILTVAEAQRRFHLGAQAVSLGTVYLLRPWRVAAIVRACQALEHSRVGG
jgi:dihydroorotate dehydrogenase